MDARPCIHTGTVISVDPARYVMDVHPDSDVLAHHTRFSDVEFGSSYLGIGGNGITVIPEVGASCFVANLGTNPNAWFAFGWNAPSDETLKAMGVGPGRRVNRPVLNPGDIRISSPSGNEIRVLTGGVIRVRSSGLAQRLYIPLNNVIRDFCERYEMQSLAGELLFEVDDDDKPQADGEFACRMRLLVRESTNAVKPVGEIVIGEQGGDTNFTLLLRNTAGAEVVKWKADKTGNLDLTMAKKFTVRSEDTVNIHGVLGAMLSSDATTEVRGQVVKVIASLLEYQVAESIETVGRKVIEGDLIQFGGDGAVHPSVRGDLLLVWMAAVSAALAAVGAPAIPPPPGLLNTTVLIS